MAEKPLVLIIDDNPSVLSSLERLIRSFGLSVQTYLSAKDFLKKAPQVENSCLLLDVRMPEIDGLELQEKILKRGLTYPIIFMTAHLDDQSRKKAMDSGAVAFLYKPLEEKSLIDALHDAIGFSLDDQVIK